MFNSKNIPLYIASLGVIFVVGTLAKQIKNPLETNDEYEMIKNYLLNESPLYGYNRPKLWIHSKYEINSRKWKDFHSRNTTDLNQDYVHLTIKTIINHCGEDFNICLIDDDSFSKLLPDWDVDVLNMAEPRKSNYRAMGMAQLLYVYGGMTLPNSFVCLKNLKNFYDEHVAKKTAFVCEAINRTTNISEATSSGFIPSIDIMGADKGNQTILKLVNYLKNLNMNGHFTDENAFKGSIQYFCKQQIQDQDLLLVGGEMIGIKTNKNKPILIEDLCEEAYLDLHPHVIGIQIPSEDILKRTKYQWFAVMNAQQLLDTNMIVSKYIKASITDTTNEYYKDTKQRCVVTI
jgi:hypothetical protein